MTPLALAWQQFRLERKLFWRNPSAAFFSFVLPLTLLLLVGSVFAEEQDELEVLIPGIAGMSIVSTTFVALAYQLVFLREEGVLKRLRGTPLPAGAYLGALAAHAVTNAAIQLGIVIVAGGAFFGVGWPGDWLELAVFAAAGVACFALLGAALAHAIPNFESTAPYVNAAFLPLIAISGVFYDADAAPAFLRDIAEALPLVHVIDGLSGAMVTGDGAWSGLIVVGLWTVAGGVLAVRGFSWESRRS